MNTKKPDSLIILHGLRIPLFTKQFNPAYRQAGILQFNPQFSTFHKPQLHPLHIFAE